MIDLAMDEITAAYAARMDAWNAHVEAILAECRAEDEAEEIEQMIKGNGNG